VALLESGAAAIPAATAIATAILSARFALRGTIAHSSPIAYFGLV